MKLRSSVCFLIAGLVLATSVFGSPLSNASRAQLTAGRPVVVLVEFDSANADQTAAAEKTRRRLARDDAAVLAQRARDYATVKSRVEAAVAGADAARVRDYLHFPMAVWRLSSAAALRRLESNPSVRLVHEDTRLFPVSVSDLPFIDQPRTASQGATGVGTTVAVIDGGLGNNYLNFSDFGSCTAVNTPPSTCRVVFNTDFYPGASTVTAHGTNVSAIALGVAPGSKLAMYDVFNGANATSSDIIAAMDDAVSKQATYNIVAINMSLGDGTSHASQCTNSVFEPAVVSAQNAGILTVVAAGNSGSKSGLADPACAPNVVSVGAVYDNSYGTIGWMASAAPGGQCSDSTAADKVTCFSQSAPYLSVLAPGTFVSAPNSSFQQSGTSQATPHISGAIAVLRAQYSAEPLSQTVKRLQITGIQDTDAANGLAFSRLELFAATNQGTAVSLTGSGPTTAVSGGNSSYMLTATNGGPLIATDVHIIQSLPPGANFVSASSGCTFESGPRVVICNVSSLGVGANAPFTINVTWTVSGPVYATASVTADQIDSAPASNQMLAFGIAPPPGADAPIPAWAYALLGACLLLMVIDRRRFAPLRSQA